jgi:hypothetical protein
MKPSYSFSDSSRRCMDVLAISKFSSVDGGDISTSRRGLIRPSRTPATPLILIIMKDKSWNYTVELSFCYFIFLIGYLVSGDRIANGVGGFPLYIVLLHIID